MNQTVLILIIVLAVVIVIVLFAYLHKKHIDYNENDLEQFSRNLFEKNAGGNIQKSQFIRELKEKYKCTQKEALYLLGVARKNGIIEMEEKTITLK